jgi:hypothetical protein
MATKIALVVGLILLLVIIGVVAWAMKIFRILRRANKAVANLATQPSRINVEPEPQPQWHKPKVINDYSNQLRALGFEEVGAFSIPEMGGLMILGLVHPREGLSSVVYDHTQRPASFDICADYTDGSTVTATSSAIGKSLDKRPTDLILWLGTTNAREILQAVQNHAASAPRQPIHKDEFSARFKRSYAKSVNWRLKKGGSSREEIRRHAEAKGHKLTDAQIEQSYQNLRGGYLKRLQSGCIAQYLDDQKPSADEWERIRLQTFVIAETLELKEIIGTLSDHVNLDNEQRHQLEKVEQNFGENAIVVMGKILDQNIAALGLEKIGAVQEPVSAIILKAPPMSARQRVLHGIQPGLK